MTSIKGRLVDDWGPGFSKYTLVSPYTHQQNSATPGDYFNLDPNHVFLDTEGNEMALAEMTYDMGGNYHVKRIVKRRVMVKDLPKKVMTSRVFPNTRDSQGRRKKDYTARVRL